MGDLKHEFGQISGQEWREVKEVLDFFKKNSKKVVLIKGNHDITLKPIAEKKELEIKDYYIKERVCFLHGHKLFPECLDKKVGVFVMGHRHPAVVLADRYKREKYKCFLAGKWKNKEIIILPSFFPFIEGSNIIINYKENKLFISKRNSKKFEVCIVAPVGEKAYKFGKLNKMT